MPGIFTRKAQDKEGCQQQLAIGRRPAKPFPKIKEKRLIHGIWTREYDAATGKPTAAFVQQRMREVAARLKAGKP